jgi:hypothetical protein
MQQTGDGADAPRSAEARAIKLNAGSRKAHRIDGRSDFQLPIKRRRNLKSRLRFPARFENNNPAASSNIE